MYHRGVVVVDENPVTFLDWTGEDDNEAGKEVTYRALEPETNTDSQYTKEDGKRRKIYAYNRKADEHDDHHNTVPGEARNRELSRIVEAYAAKERFFEKTPARLSGP